MSLIESFRKVVGVWCVHQGVSHGALSARMFNRDGSRLPRVMAGADLTTATYEKAMAWLSDNWPDGVDWPEGIERPTSSVDEPEGAAA